MTAEYPDAIFDPRTKENKSGVVYDAGKKTVGFAEDLTKLDEEVVAIQTALGTDDKWNFGTIWEWLQSISTLLAAHKTQHQNGGTDELSVAGLSGELADGQIPKAHDLGGTEHGADSLINLNLKISDANVDDDGDPRDPNAHKVSHQNGGTDELSVAGLSGELADNQPPKGHHATHAFGESDALSDGDIGVVHAIAIQIDGGGAVIETGIKADILVPFKCTIEGAYLLADQSGSIVIDIWKDTYANYPPTDADSITDSTPPTITTATKSADVALTDWTQSITANDTLRFNVDSVTTIERATLILRVRKTE